MSLGPSDWKFDWMGRHGEDKIKYYDHIYIKNQL